MPRRSQWEHLKTEIEQQYKEQGKVPRDLYAVYPQIPPRTLRDWYAALFPKKSPIPPNDSPQEFELKQQTTFDTYASKKIIALPSQEESDFQLARRAAREIVRDKSTAAYVRVQGILALAKLIEMRHNLPKSVLEETTEGTLQDERDNMRELSSEEIARRYREAL